MSVEKVLRGFGDDQAHKLADAWHDHERRQDERHHALRLAIDKAVSRSNPSLTLAAITLAAFAAAAHLLGQDLGAVKDRLTTVERRLDQVVTRLEAQAKIIGTIDERTRRMEQRAAAEPPTTPASGDSVERR